MCITESLCCTAEIGTALEINYTSMKKNSICYLPINKMFAKKGKKKNVVAMK